MISEEIRNRLGNQIEQIRHRKIAIYPYGINGKIVKDILEYEYHLKADLLVDNCLCEQYPFIFSLDKVDKPNNYIWIVNASAYDVNDIIAKTLHEVVDLENIINLFPNDKKVETDGFLLISTAEQHPTIAAPCPEFINIVKSLKDVPSGVQLTVGEVGVGIGASTVEICKLLNGRDVYYVFDFEDTIQALLHDLAILKNQNAINQDIRIIGKGNSHRTFDSYNWELSKLLLQQDQNTGEDVRRFSRDVFDVVYLDGAHTFFHDGLACCLLKELVKPNGYIIFDDLKWSYSKSETANTPENRALFTDEQFHDCQMTRVVNVFMEHDSLFQRISNTDDYRAIYKKVIVK